MAFNAQEQAIIKYGVSNGKTQQEVQDAITRLRTGQGPVTPVAATAQPAAQPNLLQRIGTDINNRGAANADIYKQGTAQGDTSLLHNTDVGFKLAANTAGGVLDTIGELIKSVPGGKQAIDAVGGVTSAGYNAIVDKLSNTDLFKGAAAAPDATKVLEQFLSIAKSSGDISNAILAADGAAQTAQTGVNLAKAGVDKATQTISSGVNDLKGAISPAVENAPADIMNRVARLKPTDYKKFQNMAGETPGEYLTRTGNFGAPDKIITNEAAKFAASKQAVDDALAQLPGEFKSGPVTDALNALVEKAKSVSSENVKSPYLDEVLGLAEKNNNSGLNMSEINTVKRLYERNVKLGYNKLMSPDKVELATNIDNAMRTWQVAKAQELGFTNIADLNRQTQLSKFIVDKLGEQIIGQSGLNSVNLTDWVVLSGGNPAAVAGFLTKKFFSSKTAQAKIAEMLNSKDIQPPIKAEFKSSTPQLPQPPKK